MDLFFVYFFSNFLIPYLVLFLPSSSSTLFRLQYSLFLSIELVEATTFVTYILEVRTSTGTSTTLTQVFCGFPQSLQMNDEIEYKEFYLLGHNAM
jgi:hypothetical protein